MEGRVAFLLMKEEAQALKGHLDVLLLATLEAGPRHGYAIKDELRERSRGRFDLPTGTVYPALHRLQDAGLIAGSWSVVDGRRRRTYQLTAAVGACWAVTLLAGRAWTWPIPGQARLAFGVALIAVIIALVAAAGARCGRPRVPFAVVGGVGLVVLDTAMLAAVALAAPFTWPLAVAVPASATRIALTTRAMSRGLFRQ